MGPAPASLSSSNLTVSLPSHLLSARKRDSNGKLSPLLDASEDEERDLTAEARHVEYQRRRSRSDCNSNQMRTDSPPVHLDISSLTRAPDMPARRSRFKSDYKSAINPKKILDAKASVCSVIYSFDC